jgi:hypothetical protein
VSLNHGYDVSGIRNAAREYQRAYERWIRDIDTDREPRLARRLEDRVVALSRAIKAHEDVPRWVVENTIARGLTQEAADLLISLPSLDVSKRGA